MPAIDPYLSLPKWRSALYSGEPAVIDRFLNAIDGSLPPDWCRDWSFEITRARPDRIRCYLFDRAGDASVRLWLQLVTSSRVRSGAIQSLRHSPSGDASRIGQLVAEFDDACVSPAANNSGARCTRPSFGLRSAVTSDAEMLFIRLADTANGEWPLREEAKGIWEELISTCLAEQVAIDRNELAQWLVDSGWERADVTAIVDRFFSDSEWLAKRLAVAAP